MKQTIDIRHYDLGGAIAWKADAVLSNMGLGRVAFLTGTDTGAAYVSMVGTYHGWNVDIKPKENDYVVYLEKE